MTVGAMDSGAAMAASLGNVSRQVMPEWEKRRLRKLVAGRVTNADDCRLIFDVLELWPEGHERDK